MKTPSTTRRAAGNSDYNEIYTPPYAVIPLLELLTEQNILHKNSIIWESTAIPKSSITSVFRNAGYTVFETNQSQFDYMTGNYKKFSSKHFSPLIFPTQLINITNPPYKSKSPNSNKNDPKFKSKWLARANEIGLPYSFLYPSDTPFAKSVQDVISFNCSILALGGRIDFTGKGRPHSNSCWILGNMFETNQIFYKPLDRSASIPPSFEEFF